MSGKKLACGLDQNLAAALAYAGAWVTGLIFFLIEKNNQFVRFHALQSIVFFGALTVLSLVPVIGWVLSPFLWIFGFVVWLVCMVKAYQGEEFALPIIGPLVKKTLKGMV